MKHKDKIQKNIYIQILRSCKRVEKLLHKKLMVLSSVVGKLGMVP